MKKDELKQPQTSEPKEVKSKILSRIQRQLSRKQGEESMAYTKYDQHSKHYQYLKGPVPTFPIPE